MSALCRAVEKWNGWGGAGPGAYDTVRLKHLMLLDPDADTDLRAHCWPRVSARAPCRTFFALYGYDLVCVQGRDGGERGALLGGCRLGQCPCL